MSLLLLTLAAAPLRLLHVLDQNIPTRESDLMPRWIGARAAFQGQDPYSPQVLRHIQRAYYGHALAPAEHKDPQLFLYPAPIILVLAPLTLLSWQAARLTFLLTVIPLLLWSLWLCLRSLRLTLTIPHAAVIVGIAFCSWPVMWGLRCQQPGTVAAILLFLAWFLLARGQEVLPGMLLALAMIKPQLVLPCLLWLVLWALLRRSWSFIASVATTLAALWFATDRIVPHWFSLWRASLRNYTGATKTALPLEGILGHWMGLAATVALGAACAFFLLRLRRCAPQSPAFGFAVSLALAATLNVVPSHPLMVYNYVLLFPACVLLIFGTPRNRLVGMIRSAALLVLGWDLATVPLAALGSLSGRGTLLWISLPFVDHLLPAAVTLFLLASGMHLVDHFRPAPQDALVHAQT